MMVLGLETSCDETGVAVYDGSRGLLADLVHTQAKLHAAYGGVVPELASRDHVRKLVPLVNEALARARVTLADLDGVAYTAGPGLIGALLVGASFGRTLAFALGIPALAVHHMEAHLLAPLMASPTPTLPFVALLVSGGHTQLVRVDAIGRYTILGESVDDAAGEAFDKTAKLLGLPYPGGAELARLAESGDPARFRFPRPMTDRPGLDFSFSGLKTAALQTIRSLERRSPQGLSPEDRADVARGFEEAVVETLLIKCRRALDATGIDQLVLAGGVAANRRLRTVLAADLAASTYYPPLNLCTDNGAMIAFAGYQRLAAGENSGLVIDTRSRWPLDELSALADG